MGIYKTMSLAKLSGQKMKKEGKGSCKESVSTFVFLTLYTCVCVFLPLEDMYIIRKTDTVLSKWAADGFDAAADRAFAVTRSNVVCYLLFHVRRGSWFDARIERAVNSP